MLRRVLARNIGRFQTRNAASHSIFPYLTNAWRQYIRDLTPILDYTPYRFFPSLANAHNKFFRDVTLILFGNIPSTMPRMQGEIRHIEMKHSDDVQIDKYLKNFVRTCNIFTIDVLFEDTICMKESSSDGVTYEIDNNIFRHDKSSYMFGNVTHIAIVDVLCLRDMYRLCKDMKWDLPDILDDAKIIKKYISPLRPDKIYNIEFPIMILDMSKIHTQYNEFRDSIMSDSSKK
jgi:hypothetical protein